MTGNKYLNAYHLRRNDTPLGVFVQGDEATALRDDIDTIEAKYPEWDSAAVGDPPPNRPPIGAP